MASHDLTKGSIAKHLWALGWPMMLSMLLHTLYNVVDSIWVASLSPVAVAATNISRITLFTMVGLGLGLAVGSTVLIGMNIGAKKIKRAEAVLGQSYVLAAIVAIIFTAFGLIFKNQLLIIGGATGTIFPLADTYFTITMAGSILFFLLFPTMFAFRAQGDANTPLIITAISVIVNAIIDPIMIFGWFGFPAMGIAGAAYATLVSQVLVIGMGIYLLRGDKYQVKFRWPTLLKLDKDIIMPMLFIGLPAAITQVVVPFGFLASTKILSEYFLEAGATAFAIAFTVEFFSFIPAFGFGTSAQAIMAQNFGAKKFRRVKESFTKAAVASFAFATIFGLILMFAAPWVTRVLTTDQLALDYVRSYTWIVPLSYGFFALLYVIGSAFQGLGRAWPAFWVLFAKFFIITIPATWILFEFFNTSIVAAWVMTAIGSIGAAVFGLWWIMRFLAHVIKHDEDKHLEELTS